MSWIGSLLESSALAPHGFCLLWRPGLIDHLLAHPNGHLTPTDGNLLWHVAVLEWWLQEHLDR